MSNESFGDRVKRLRERARMSQDALARETGITKSAIWDLEKGNSTWPHAHTRARLAAALGVSETYLLTGYEPGTEGERISLEEYLRRYTILTEDEVAQVVRVTEWMETEHRIQAGELELVERLGGKENQFNAEGETRRAAPRSG